MGNLYNFLEILIAAKAKYVPNDQIPATKGLKIHF